VCWITVLFHVHRDYPLIVAANREESRSRLSQPPLQWPGSPAIWAGRDARHGGTWLGVNDAGLLAAVTNRPEDEVDRARPSRGLLCLETLRCDSPQSARAFFVNELAARRYNPCNLLCVNHREGWVGTWQGVIRDLTPGLHVLSNYGDLDDDRLPVVRTARARIETMDLTSPRLDELLGRLGSVCANTDDAFPLCRVGGERGTVSSSLVALDADGTIAAYWYAPGPPSAFAYSVVPVSTAA
jgi:uncharacterized protein with NRDE domain